MTRSKLRRRLFAVVRVLLLVYVGFTVMLYGCQSRLLYHPIREITATPADAGVSYEDVRLTAADGVSLTGWFVPAGADADVVLFCHGNAGNISHRIESIAVFHRLGLSVLIFDYRGYGASDGSPSEEGTYADAMAAWTHLTDTRGFAPERVIVFGRSLGGAVAAWLATQVRPRALIVESTFTSVPDLGADLFPFVPIRWISRFSYGTRAAIARAPCPVLVAHSRDDDLIPFHHGQAVYAAAPEPKQFLELRGGHNAGFLVSGRTYTDGLKAFLDAH